MMCFVVAFSRILSLASSHPIARETKHLALLGFNYLSFWSRSELRNKIEQIKFIQCNKEEFFELEAGIPRDQMRVRDFFLKKIREQNDLA